MAKNIKEAVQEFAKPIVEKLGYEYADIDFSKQGKDWVLTIYIDSENGIDLDDCEKVSRAIDPVLDEKDPIEQAYILCVSSVGLDKPLKTQRDFEKALGSCIDVKLYKSLNGKKELSGMLEKFEDDIITLECGENDKLEINIKDTAKITYHIDF